MKLSSVHVKNFRSIADSTEVAIDPEVTALVGRNESGKTAFLEALYRINPAQDALFNESAHYPRWRLIADRRAGTINAVPALMATFTIDEDDRMSVVSLLGEGVLEGDLLTISRDYTNTASFSVTVNPRRALQNVFADIETSVALQSILEGDAALLGNAAKALKAAVPSEDEEWTATERDAVVVEIERRTKGQNTQGAVASILRARPPKMFYFADYQTLPGRINVTELAGNETPGQSDTQTARALLKLAYTDVESLTDEDFEERTAELEAVSNDLTKRVLSYWRQNDDLSIQINADKVTTQNTYNGQSAVVRYLDVRVRDARHGFTNNFDQRSNGFKWFFSFLAAFSEFENYEHGVVVLLDEPALTLHGKAQADFLDYIDGDLSKIAQVVYTTHSPFLVDAARLDRVRIVEDKGGQVGSVVSSEALSVGEDSLFPLQAALGYDIAQNLFIGRDNLVLEGTSDFTYLVVMSDHLISLGRVGLDPRWRLLPAGSASNIPAFVALIGRSLDVTVVIDGSTKASVQRLQALGERGLLAKKRLLLTDEYTTVQGSDIEDLFSVGDYLTMYNGAFGGSIKAADLNGKDRIVARLSRYLESDFTAHGRPADYLLRNRDRVVPKFSATTLSNFEKLFVAVNATLS
jgi:predicted ATPase